MSDAERQPTTVSGAAQTISGLLNPTADTQETAPATESVVEETRQTEDTIAPSDLPNKNLSEEETQEDIPQEEESTEDIVEAVSYTHLTLPTIVSV